MSPIRPENRDRYPDDWKQISLRIRTVRAAGRCECAGECGVDHAGRCTAENGQPHPVTGSKVVLTTAHRDHTPENVDDANLFAACQRCHLRYDRDHHRATAAATRRAAAEAAGQLALAAAEHLMTDDPAAVVPMAVEPGIPCHDEGHARTAVHARRIQEAEETLS